MSEIAPLYKACSSCQEARQAGLFDQVTKCNRCDGKGLVRIPATYTCNMCGCGLCEDDEPYPSGLVEAQVGGGFNSFHLFDCSLYQFSICENCLRNKLFPLFKNPPKVFEQLDSEYSTYEQDLKHYHHRVWQRDGGRKIKFASGLCNYTEDCPEKPVWRALYNGDLNELCVCEAHRSDVSHSYRLAPVASIPSEVLTPEDAALVAKAWLDAPDRFQLYLKALREGTTDQGMP